MRKPNSTLNQFERAYEIIKTIPRGKVLTYGIVSYMMNRRISAAAVGWALNGLPYNRKKKYSLETVPWHRVVNSQGKISTKLPSNINDASGTPFKLQRILLENEGVLFKDDGSIDLSRYLFMPSSKRKANDSRKKTLLWHGR